MPFRLLATLEHGRVRLPLRDGDNLIGSGADCAVRLHHPSVSRHHARLTVADGRLTVEDLGSANGILIGSRAVRRGGLVPGQVVYFGRVFTVVEEVPAGDLEAAVEMPAAGADEAAAPTPGSATGGSSTAALAPVESFTLDQLPGVVAALRAGAPATEMAQRVGEALYTSLPVARVEVLTGPGGEGTLFAAAAEGVAIPAEAVTVEAREGRLLLRVTFLRSGMAEVYRPLVETAAGLLGLAAERPRGAASAAAGRPASPPDPPSVVPAVRRIYDEAARVAGGEVGVLISGESGTGKEVLARFLHAASPRPAGPFVALNCAALPRDLLEAELFGIEKGVATGVEPRPGKFELADQGTLFLDEIGDMAPDTQARILRVLQEREVFRLGGSEARPARTRIVAATNRDVGALLADGRFREDLYHRVATWTVEMPPLRRRRADVPNLAAWFLAREGSRAGRRLGGISRAALEALCRYPWPGNVRQLENEMARAALFLEDGELLDTARLSPPILEGREAAGGGAGLAAILAAVERDEILQALARAGGDVAVAAGRLGVSRATLYRRMKQLEVAADRG